MTTPDDAVAPFSPGLSEDSLFSAPLRTWPEFISLWGLANGEIAK
jgi:hypothetical protein